MLRTIIISNIVGGQMESQMDQTAPEDGLMHGERLLIRTVRRLALRTACHGLQAHFEQACGWAGAEAYRTLEVFLQQLSLRGRRRLALSVPLDVRLTGDEMLLLDLFGCAQAEDYRALDERLASLTGAPPQTAMGAAACFVAQTLAYNGLCLRPHSAPSLALRMAAE